MANTADSEAHFEERAVSYGVPRNILRNFKDAGIRTLAHMAFGMGRPGQDFDETAFSTWIRQVIGQDPSLGTAAALRRLHFEAEVVVTAIVRATVEHPTSEQSVPKPTLYAERQVRMVQIRQQLGGVILEGHNEPAYSLVDECCFQYETRCLRYVEPAKCASREAEVTSGKLNKKLHLDGSSLTVKESKNIPDESVNNAYQLMLCFRRRAVAYEFSGLISYRSHERYTDSLMRHLQQDPPPNFHSTSITQVLRADKEVFSYLSKHCDNIRPDAAGVKPLDNMLMEALRDYHVAFHLMPLPQSASAQQRREPSDTKTSPSAPYPARPQKGKGKGKQKNGPGLTVAPRGFPGCVGKDNKGRSLCFDFNIKGCKHAAAGGVCKNGRHNCFLANCFQPHAWRDAHGPDKSAVTTE